MNRKILIGFAAAVIAAAVYGAAVMSQSVLVWVLALFADIAIVFGAGWIIEHGRR